MLGNKGNLRKENLHRLSFGSEHVVELIKVVIGQTYHRACEDQVVFQRFWKPI